MTDTRDADPRVLPHIVGRWSPRAFDASDIAPPDLQTLFDAARWAPSAFNAQPWRFLYARRGDAHWDDFLKLLLPGNAGWAQNASALIFILSDTLMEKPGNEPAPSWSHSFDAGAAWAMMALQARALGYYSHGMTGVNFEAARVELRVPDRFRIEAAVAIGRRGDPASLPEPLQEREKPSGRNRVESFAFAGRFPVEGASR